MPIQYMTTSGDWTCSCEEGTPPPSPSLILAPADADGFHGADGMRWTGAIWIYDPGASARAEAVMYPAQALAAERAGMVADKWQLVAALDLIDSALWPRVVDFRASAQCDPVTGAAIDWAVTLPRLSQTIDMLTYLLGLDAAQTDHVFRVAMQIRG